LERASFRRCRVVHPPYAVGGNVEAVQMPTGGTRGSVSYIRGPLLRRHPVFLVAVYEDS
jgi:hypothetical protein